MSREAGERAKWLTEISQMANVSKVANSTATFRLPVMLTQMRKTLASLSTRECLEVAAALSQAAEDGSFSRGRLAELQVSADEPTNVVDFQAYCDADNAIAWKLDFLASQFVDLAYASSNQDVPNLPEDVSDVECLILN